jgi:GNAT superfamily N-acetyltransferase
MEKDHRKETMQTSIQTATEKDIPDIQRLCFALMQHVKQWSTTLDENWIQTKDGEEYIRSCIQDKKNTVLKAIAGNQIAGFAIGSTTEKPYRLERTFADLDFFYVDPNFRGQHVGSALLRRFTQWCKEKNAHVIRVETTYSNVDGQSFYYKKGFNNYELVLEKKLK